MEPDFEDIKIVGLDDEQTVPSHDNPALFYIYLRLSQTPPPYWLHQFRERRKIPRHTRWRKAWIDRKFIVVECRAEEIESHHLADLKQDVAHANAQYRAYLSTQHSTETHRHQAHEQEKDKLREIKGRLSFD